MPDQLLNEKKRSTFPILLVLRGTHTLLAVCFLILIARAFGTTSRADLFFVAQIFPILVGYQLKDALNLSFISTYTQVRVKGDEDRSSQLAGLCFYLVMITVIIITVVYALIVPGLLYRYSGLTNLPKEIYVNLIVCLSPIIIFISLYGLLESILYSHGRFILAAAANLFFYSSGIVFILLFTDSLDIFAPAIGLTLGCFFQFFIVFFSLGKVLPLKKLLLPRLGSEAKKSLKLFIKRLMPTLYVASFLQLAFIIQRLLAMCLGEGNVSLITYSTRLTFFLPLVLVSALVIPSLSSLSENIAQNRTETYKTQIRDIIKTIIVLMLPTFVWLLIFREDLIRVLMERGMFSATDTQRLSYLLIFAFPGMLPAIFIAVYRQSLLSMNKIRLLMSSATISISIGVVLSLILMFYLGVNGIVLGTTVSIFLRFFLLHGFMEKESGRLWGANDVFFVFKIILISGLCLVFSWILDLSLSTISAKDTWVGVFLNYIFYMSMCLLVAVKAGAVNLPPSLLTPGSHRGMEDN